MATVRRSRTLPATPQELWVIVSDPHHLPRWWPRVTRVEGVREEGFTQVLQPAKGKPVRADFLVVESSGPSVRRWAQEVAGTPFERILAAAETEVRLEPDGAGTRVEISLSQRPRGLALLGAFMVRSAAGRQVDEALAGLEALVTASSSSGSASGPDPGSSPGRRRAGRAG